MQRHILGSSDLPIISENRCSRKWVNKTEGPKIAPMKQSKGLRLHLIEKLSTKLIQKNSLTSMAYESQLTDKQKFQSTPKKNTPSLEQLTVYSVITINNLICLMIYILKRRTQHLLV
jgi:hypothetical protein